MARLLTAQGAMVAGIDTPQLFEQLIEDGGDCVFPDGDLENLARFVQAYYRLPTYHTPILIGYSSGGTLAYASLAQAPAGTFAGAMSLGFCTDLNLTIPLCKAENLHHRPRKAGGFDLLPAAQLRDPWIVLQGEKDDVCPAGPARTFASQVKEHSSHRSRSWVMIFWRVNRGKARSCLRSRNLRSATRRACRRCQKIWKGCRSSKCRRREPGTRLQSCCQATVAGQVSIKKSRRRWPKRAFQSPASIRCVTSGNSARLKD